MSCPRASSRSRPAAMAGRRAHVLALGERTGHAHWLPAEPRVCFFRADAGPVGLTLGLRRHRKADHLRHDEHRPIRLVRVFGEFGVNGGTCRAQPRPTRSTDRQSGQANSRWPPGHIRHARGLVAAGNGQRDRGAATTDDALTMIGAPIDAGTSIGAVSSRSGPAIVLRKPFKTARRPGFSTAVSTSPNITAAPPVALSRRG